MELIITRHQNPASTIGELAVDGSPFTCVTLEDVDRGLTQSMSLQTIAAIKVQNKTAIPAGRYQVIINYSERFQRVMPLLVDVPGFAGVRIHWGNTDADTDGCILLGTAQVNNDFIGNSREAFASFWAILKSAIDNDEKVFINIK